MLAPGALQLPAAPSALAIAVIDLPVSTRRFLNIPAHLTAGAQSTLGSLDFVSDTLSDGRRLRILCIVDDVSRERLATVVDTSLNRVRMVRELGPLTRERATPRVIVSDKGTELSSNAVLCWAADRVFWHYIQPGKPVEKASSKSFTIRLRDECLNQHVFIIWRTRQRSSRRGGRSSSSQTALSAAESGPRRFPAGFSLYGSWTLPFAPLTTFARTSPARRSALSGPHPPRSLSAHHRVGKSSL